MSKLNLNSNMILIKYGGQSATQLVAKHQAVSSKSLCSATRGSERDKGKDRRWEVGERERKREKREVTEGKTGDRGGD